MDEPFALDDYYLPAVARDWDASRGTAPGAPPPTLSAEEENGAGDTLSTPADR